MLQPKFNKKNLWLFCLSCFLLNTYSQLAEHSLGNAVLTLNIPSLGRQRCLPSWGPRRTPWVFCNFSTV